MDNRLELQALTKAPIKHLPQGLIITIPTLLQLQVIPQHVIRHPKLHRNTHNTPTQPQPPDTVYNQQWAITLSYNRKEWVAMPRLTCTMRVLVLQVLVC